MASTAPPVMCDDATPDHQVDRYRELIETYDGLSGSTRRPDIGIRIRKADGPVCLLLIVAKHATPTSQYGGVIAGFLSSRNFSS